MSRKRPSLQEVQRLYPSDLSRCAGYVWHLGTRIGKGSFGEVYLGWTNDGKEEVAVKAVSKGYFKQDPKVRENLEREIRIMKLLKNCEYVVRLLHVQDMKQHIVLVMELCEYDLDYLVKLSPFREDDITLFLFQLGQGMKALREQNIVHRDLKPGNILIKKHPVSGKMKIKLADFGFARHFTEEGTKKPIDMHSLAGTPVFMAPEALRCVFYPGEHYDDKVDIWSIGALLYKIIVGQCGFYAQLQDIPKILKHKKDAIAFERVGRNVNYIQELPPSVYDRLSPDYRAKMNSLLKHLLKLDPQDRMNFHEFFEFVEDLVHSKIEVINLLQGTSGKIMYDGGMKVDGLKKEIHDQLGVSPANQLVFSTACPHSLSPNAATSSDHFSQLMEKCGASRGNGVLYLLPINEILRSEGSTDVPCLNQLRFGVSDQTRCVELITDHKFSNEIVHAINLLQNQQKRQETGVRDFSKFCSQEFDMFKTHGGYQEVYREGLQTLARVTLATEWLERDLEGLSTSGGPQEMAHRMLRSMKQHKTDVGKMVIELDTLYRSCEQQLSRVLQETGDSSTADITLTAELIKDAKKLPELRRVEVFGRCQTILHKCEDIVKRAGGTARHRLHKLYSALANIWDMTTKSNLMKQLCQQVEDVLTKQMPPLRSSLLSSLSSGSKTQDVALATTPASAPPVIVTPPGWPRPPPGPGGHSVPSSPYQPSPSSPYQHSPNSQAAQPHVGVVSVGSESKALAALRDERDQYESLFQEKAEECAELAQVNVHLKQQLSQQRKPSSSSMCEEEKTLAPGSTLQPTTPTEDRSLRPASLTPEDVRVLEGLREQLKSFCLMADHLKPGLSPGNKPRAQTSPSPLKSPGSPALYPNLDGNPDLREYSIITMPGSPERQNSETALAGMGSQESVQLLIPQASQLMAALKDGLKDLGLALSVGNSVSAERTEIKIAKPREYIQGDIVLFNPLRLPYSKLTAPIIMHSEKPYPYIFMDKSSYSLFGIRPGRIPDLIVARLAERPRAFRFEEDREMTTEFPNTKGEFYRVKVEATPFKFMQSKGPPRPPLPRHRLPFMHRPAQD